MAPTGVDVPRAREAYKLLTYKLMSYGEENGFENAGSSCHLSMGRFAGKVMGEYLPYSGTNSIQEAVVALHFRDRITSEAVERARNTAQTDLKAAFPHFSEIRQAPAIKISQTGVSAQPGPSLLAGFECSKVKADAKPARVLRFLDNLLAVNFLEYRDWQTTLKDSLEYIRIVLSSLSSVPLATNPVQAFSLRYIDRYTFDGPPQEPNASMLFLDGNAYMTPRCFSSGPVWHCHSGWFEVREAGDRILNQLNVSSAMVEEGVSTSTVDHNAVWQLGVPRQTTESIFGPSSDENTYFEDAFNLLHERNSEILKNMLLPDMLKKIGM